jgi:hypothetical protein
MIAAGKEAGRNFKQWAPLLSGKLLVKIIVYADESGTHDGTGILPGSEVAVFAGFAAKVESWVRFRKDWQAVLEKHSAPYFHFSEWSDASAVARKTRPATSEHPRNPYYGWSIDRLDSFWLKLASVADAGRKLKLGGYVDTRGYAESLKNNPEQPYSNPHEYCLWQFYEAVVRDVRANWPRLREPVSFVYDRGNPSWQNAIFNIHRSYQKLESRVKEIAFADKKVPLHSPLQAADMLAYRLRQIAAKKCHYDKRVPDSLSSFDRALFGKGFDKFSELYPGS